MITEDVIKDFKEAEDMYREAKLQMAEAQSYMTRAAEALKNIPLHEAIRVGVVKFNFPTPPRFKEFFLGEPMYEGQVKRRD